MFFDGIGTGVIEEGVPDGMKCDERGNIWVTGPGGVWVISAAAEHLGVVEVPENVGNLNWGGADWKDALHPELDVAVPRPDQGRVGQASPTTRERRHVSEEPLRLDPKRSALIIQDLQNDVIIEGGAFADSGAPAHANEPERGRERRPSGRSVPAPPASR